MCSSDLSTSSCGSNHCIYHPPVSVDCNSYDGAVLYDDSESKIVGNIASGNVSPTYSREAVSRMEIMTPRYLVVYGTPMGIMKIDDCG